MGAQHFSIDTTSISTHDPTLLALYHRAELGVAHTATVAAQIRLAAGTARDGRAEHAVFRALARRTAKRSVNGALGERRAGFDGCSTYITGTENGERGRADGKKGAERKRSDTTPVGTGELAMKRKEEGNGVGGAEPRDGALEWRITAGVVRTLVLIEGTDHLHMVIGTLQNKRTYHTGTELALVHHFPSTAYLLSTLQRSFVIIIHSTGTLLGPGVTETVTAKPVSLLADAVGGAVLVGVGAGPEGAGELGAGVGNRAVEGGWPACVVVTEDIPIRAGECGWTVERVEGVMKEVGAEKIGEGNWVHGSVLVEEVLENVGNTVVAYLDVGYASSPKEASTGWAHHHTTASIERFLAGEVSTEVWGSGWTAVFPVTVRLGGHTQGLLIEGGVNSPQREAYRTYLHRSTHTPPVVPLDSRTVSYSVRKGRQGT